MNGVALSVRQPWAWAIVAGHKDVENRSWSTNYRGPLLIHASKRKPSVAEAAAVAALVPRGVVVPIDDFVFGAIIGVVDLGDVVTDSSSRWAHPGAFHWLLENARILRPTPCMGRLGLFTPGASSGRKGATLTYQQRTAQARARRRQR